MEKALSDSAPPPHTTGIVEWLVESGLGGCEVPHIVAGLGRRLNAAGIAADRVGCSILTLHPQFVSQEATWLADGGSAITSYYTPKLMEDPDNRRGPYFELALNRLPYKRFPLDAGSVSEDIPLLARLRHEGYTEYFAFFHATGGAGAITPFARRVGLVPCVVGSFATRQAGGFGDGEIDCLTSISKPLALATKARTNFETVAHLLDLYVGRSCGSQVLDGRITRDDCERISCGIWFCDLRQSSQLVAQLPLDDYIALLNRYFDVTVGAIMDAGGEVLKFIGDAVMGIFRSDHPEIDTDMRHRALAAAMRTLQDISALEAPGQPLKVGIALHVGEVMYGNVGTDERLDFTVIGRAVNEAARLQELTKRLGHAVLASASFVGPIRERFEFSGTHAVAGFDEGMETYVPRA